MNGADFSPVLQRALDHKNALPMRCVEVPEWGGGDTPLLIYWKPWTSFEKRQVYGAAGVRDEYQIACRVIERKALDADGNRLFKDGEASFLERGAHDDVVGFVAKVIVNDRDADAVDDGGERRNADAMGTENAVEDAAKN